MARKDLNFSLDDGFAAEVRPPKKASGRGRGKRSGNERPVARQKRAWPAAALVMLINIAFGAGAVYWYSGGDLRTLAEGRGITDAAMARLEVQLASLEVRMAGLAASLQPELADHSVQIQTLTTTLEQVRADLKQVQEQLAATPEPLAQAAASADEWLLNLGSFDQAEAARELVQQSEALGHSAQIIEQSASGQPVYVVALAGFEDRAAAETRAQEIMLQTELNGLWAWKRE